MPAVAHNIFEEDDHRRREVESDNKVISYLLAEEADNKSRTASIEEAREDMAYRAMLHEEAEYHHRELSSLEDCYKEEEFEALVALTDDPRRASE